MSTASYLASHFHRVYEELAPSFGWDTQPESRVAWPDLPDRQRELMIATVQRLLDVGFIDVPTETGVDAPGHPFIDSGETRQSGSYRRRVCARCRGLQTAAIHDRAWCDRNGAGWDVSTEPGDAANVSHGPESLPTDGRARTVGVSDRTGQPDPDLP